MKKFANAMFATLAILLMAATSWGVEPPPPVNQSLGIPDSVFDALAEPDCRGCHNQNPPITAVDPTYLPDRHHLLVGMAVPSPTAAPNPTVGGGTYECLTCHTQTWDPALFAFVFEPFRDCMLCHSQVAGEGTVHHMTATAQGGDCVACHGDFVQNMDDGHYIPTYQPSIVTPWPSKKPNADNDPGLVGAGNCNFCHNTVALPTLQIDPVLDPASGVMVYRNPETHHTTGFGGDGTKCTWCHYQGSNTPQALSIRTCEGCHGVSSLHNIQLGLGATTQPGNEPAYRGHIGAQWDCWGCHGNNGQTMSAPYSGPVIPSVDSLSASTFVEGTDTTITVTGASFINSIVNPTTGTSFNVDCDIKLVDALGNITTLQPVSQTNDTIQVVIPGYLTVGSYTLTAVKGPSDSNPKIITVKPAVTIASAACDNGTVTVRGSGFGAYADAANSGTSVTMLDGTDAAKCKVSAWTDSEITAQCAAGDTIQVASVFGKASSPVAGCDPQPVILPAITKLSTLAARAGTKITVYGNNFGATQSDSFVEFGTVKARVSSWKATAVSVYVPKISKGSYPVSVTVAGQESNAIKFTVK